MRRTTAVLLLAAGGILLCLPGRSTAQDVGELGVSLARVGFNIHGRTGAPRHALKIKGTFPTPAGLTDFDPTVHGLHVQVANLTALDVPAAADPDGYRFRTRRGELRSWRYRSRGVIGATGVRSFSANTRTGRFKLVIRRADLTLLRESGARDVTVSVTVGDATAELTFSLVVTNSISPVRWLYRPTSPSPVPPGPPTPPPVPPGPLAFTSLVRSSLPNTPRPQVEIARTQQQFDAMWTTLGNPGPRPQVDFSQDMVVTVSALVRGPGPFPPLLDVVAVRNRGFMEIDWRLALCEQNLCPGAPGIPCPTATPFHVFKVRRYTGAVSTVQKATLGVCP